MTEEYPNVPPIEDVDSYADAKVAEDADVHVSQADIESEIERSVAPLRAYQERGGIGSESRRLAGERILQVAGIVRDNPERVASDIEKSPQNRTEHDPERAHLKALVTDKNMTELAADQRRIDAGKRIWRKTQHGQSLLGANIGNNMAAEVYDDDPIEAGPNAAELRRLQSISANASYKYIGKVKGSA